MLSRLTSSWSDLRYAVLSGVLFGIYHYWYAFSYQVLDAAAAGFVLAVLYRKSGSLLACIALHGLDNALGKLGEIELYSIWSVPPC